MSVELLDAAGRPRSPATIPGYRRGSIPRNKGRRYPADPPRIEEIIAMMRTAGASVHGQRIRALIVILWRAGLRINEALTLAETDLEPARGSILVRHGKGGICCYRHMPPSVALRTMWRSIEYGRCLWRMGVVGATYFGRYRSC